MQKTPELEKTIRQAHAYYADAEDYHFFMVLTQSCDLVRRGKGRPRSRYISIAAVRPLDVLVGRLLKKYEEAITGVPITICRRQSELAARQYLERLLHNTESDVFFIRKGSHPVFLQDYCVFLNLSIALRVDHYEACTEAKVAQLSDVFQAKVGWLTGNMYSRVGTPDFEEFEQDPETYKKVFFDETIYKQTAWLSAEQVRELKQIAKQEGHIHEQEMGKVLSALKDDITNAAERAAKKLVEKGLIQKEKEKEAINILASDKAFKKYVQQK